MALFLRVAANAHHAHSILRSKRGRVFTLRTVSARDVEGLAAFLGSLSKDALYMRYLSLRLHQDAGALMGEAQRLAGGNGGLRTIVVAQSCERGQPIVAVAELVGDAAHLTSAELALAVADAYQGEGIGQTLAAHLLEAGAQRGLTSVYAAALAENIGLRRLIASLRLPYSEQIHWGDATYRIDLVLHSGYS